jgi:hypothetical protein
LNSAALDLIDEAITILARHPFIGRQAEHDMRELVISQGKQAMSRSTVMNPAVMLF